MRQSYYQQIIIIITLLLGGVNTYAQVTDTTELNIDNMKIIITEKGDTIKKKNASGRHTISIGTNGIKYVDKFKIKRKHKKLHTSIHFDFGMNNIIDNSNYLIQSLSQQNQVLLQDSSMRPLNNKDLALRNGKSINFNFWPLWLKQDIAKHNVQLETGLGLQFFNYRFNSTVKHTDDAPRQGGISTTTPSLVTRSGFEDISDPNRLTGKEKNKLGISYISVPLMIRFNSHKKSGSRYFIGAGVIGSYKLKSWTKFYGDKNAGNFGLNNWMTQLTAELGVTGIIKIYGTYALQSMYENGLDRRPFAIGIRL